MSSLSWSALKGIPSSTENVVDIVFSCYNFLAIEIDCKRKTDSSENWYNKEVYTCCLKVVAFLKNNAFTLPNEETVSCDMVVSKFEEIVSCADLYCTLFHSVEALAVCIIFIWYFKLTPKKSQLTECRSLMGIFEKMPFDCMIDTRNICRYSRAENSLWWLEELCPVKKTEVIVHKEDTMGHLHHIRMLMKAYFLFLEGEYKKSLQILTKTFPENEVTNSKLVQLNMPNIYNLMACCCANLCMNETALMYLRKSLQFESTYTSATVFNLALVYKELEKWSVVSQTMDILVSLLLAAKQCSNEIQTCMVVHCKDRLKLVLPSDISVWNYPARSWDLQMGLYAAANLHSQAQSYKQAVDLYSRLDNANKWSLTPNSSPIREGMLAEKQFAMSESKLANNGIITSVRKMKEEMDVLKTNLDVYHAKLENRDDHLEMVVYFGKRLFCYICYLLHCAKQNFHSCQLMLSYEILHMWTETVYILPERQYNTAEKDLLDAAKLTFMYLNAIQAKLLLNKVIIMIFEREEERLIFRTLKSIFKFDPQSIEIRWSVTMLLWKMGQKNEACKTWMKTRGMDYHMDIEKVKELLHKMVSNASGGALYRRDIAILKEILKGRQHQ